MIIKLFKEFNSLSSICNKCGEEFWAESDICDDCKDSDLEIKEPPKIDQESENSLPFFGVPTTKSQNIYYL